MSDVEDWPHFGMAGSVTCMHDWVSRACTCMHDWGVASLGCGGCAGPGFWQHAMHNALQRNGELRQLEADLGDLHTLFKDVATLAQLQQVSMPLRPTPAASGKRGRIGGGRGVTALN